MSDIYDIYKMLDWENPPEIQAEGVRLAKQVEDLSLLIQPPASPSVWEKCAEILSEKGEDELQPYLPSLLEWLQDLNWPGAWLILNRLKSYSGRKLKKPFVDCVIIAIHSGDTEDSMWLDFLAELLDNEALKTELPQDILDILQSRYHHWYN